MSAFGSPIDAHRSVGLLIVVLGCYLGSRAHYLWGHQTVAARVPLVVEAPHQIDINCAPLRSLMQLPGVGAALGQRIIASRRHLPFSRVSDLRQVSGIGPSSVERWRPIVRVGDPDLCLRGVEQ